MSFDLISSVLFGQGWLLSPEVITLLKLIIAIPLPIFLGTWLAKQLRLRDYGWKLSLIFCVLAIGGVLLVSFPLRLGVDLKGGVILVYEVDREAREAEDPGGASLRDMNWGHLLQRLNDRINPAGTKEIVVRRYGDWQVEIIVPDVDTNEVERIKRLISTAGSLEFRIVANSVQHGDAIQAAVQQADDPVKRRSKYIVQDNQQKAYWARVGREANEVKGGFRPLKVQVASYTIRNSSTGEIIQLPTTLRWDQEYALEQWLKEQGIQDVDVLMYTGDEHNVSGENLGMVSSGYDEVARPCVMFNMKTSGAGLMGGLTGENLPDEQRGFYSLLGIMLDGTLLSAPRVMSTITDSGRITGQFTREEVDFLVGILQAGSLPASLKKVPIAQNTIGAVLGEETIYRGKIAAVLALSTTFVFMLAWYRFAGLVACFALAANLLLILAMMKFPLRAPLTLPGLAGLVLSVGMAVDANVLIYERIREELERGSALRMAIRNGFDRAMVTIIDSNLTTLITSVVMYVIGTDQVRGFAITLTLGILISMFTAVFCGRVMFEICERKRFLVNLRMTKLLGVTHINFLGQKYVAITASILFIVVGLVATGVRGKQIFDIDFLGGTSVTMILQESAEEREIRTKLDQEFAGIRVNNSAVQYSVNRVDVEGQKERTVWKIDSSLEEVEQLEDILQQLFPVATHSVIVNQIQEKRTPVSLPPGSPPAQTPAPPATDETQTTDTVPAPQAAESKPEPAPESKPESAPEPTPEPEGEDGAARRDLPPATMLALASEGDEMPASAETPEPETPQVSVDVEPERKPADADTETVTTGAEPSGAEEPKPAARTAEAITTQATLTFDYRINGDSVIHEIMEASQVVDVLLTEEDVIVDLNPTDLADNPDWTIRDSVGYKEWIVTLAKDRAEAEKVFHQLSKRMQDSPVWSTSSKIGGKVAGDTRKLALVALVTSWVGIVIFIWIRFQKVAFGLAAVVALIHDVLVAVGAIALSYWLAGVFGFLGIQEFKISLTVVVAFLTIVGYSVNDTIVIFDRIREVRGKSAVLTADMINSSINQTLSRTILTSLTTLISTLVLFAVGGEGIHAFAFTLFVGFLSGTYSSIYIATPFVLWLYGGKPQARAVNG